MLVRKAYKYQLYPNQEQQEALAVQFGHARFVYNHFLQVRYLKCIGKNYRRDDGKVQQCVAKRHSSSCKTFACVTGDAETKSPKACCGVVHVNECVAWSGLRASGLLVEMLERKT
jgi:putative transposase